MKKLITFVVPCYNSASYMQKCIDSLLTAGDCAEIILVNDGSTLDDTALICDQYALKYPNIVVAIHQENGGHGEGVNQGIRNAKGKYFKVVDSDDWVCTDSLKQILDKLNELESNNINLDLMISNYVYEYAKDNSQNSINYKNVLPENKIFTWDDIGNFKPHQYILMHSVIYKTQVLKDVNLKLPKHTFYVDNIFVYQPLPNVKSIYYLNLDFYRYYIGRDDQSVNETVMLNRIEQQYRITKHMIEHTDLSKLTNNSKLKKYMIHYLSIMITICNILSLLKKENTLNTNLWSSIKNKLDSNTYKHIRYFSLANISNLKFPFSNSIILYIYRTARKFIKFS